MSLLLAKHRHYTHSRDCERIAWLHQTVETLCHFGLADADCTRSFYFGGTGIAEEW